MANNIDIIISAKDMASGAVERAKASIASFSKSSIEASQSLATYGGILAGVLTAGIVKYGGEVQTLNNKLVSVTGSQKLANETFKNLLGIANASGGELSATVGTFQKFEMTNKSLGITTAETYKMVDALNKGLMVSGASAEEAASAQLQLAQAYASGVLQGDEFRALGEAFPLLMQNMAKNLNVTSSELKKMGSEGLITRDIISTALLGVGESATQMMNGMSFTIPQAMNIFKNTFVSGLKEINDNTGIFNTISEMIVKMGNTFSNQIPMIVSFISSLDSEKLTMIGGVIAGVLTPAIIGLGISLGTTLLTVAPFALLGLTIAKNWEPIKEIIGNVTEKFKRFNEQQPGIVLITGAIFGVAGALMLLNANPIFALITAGSLLILNWEKVKLNVGGALFFMIKDFKEGFAKIISYFKNFFPNLESGFKELVNRAKEWGGNLIKMFISGLSEKVTALRDSIVRIATTISDYLGFHSPTKMGPASDSDTWMPNFVKMLIKGIDENKGKFSDAVIRLSSSIFENFGKGVGMGQLQATLDILKGQFTAAFSGLGADIETSIGKIKGLNNELAGLDSRLESLKKQRKEGNSKLEEDLANRAIQIEKELANEQLSLEEKIKLQKELTLATEKAGIVTINELKNWNAKTESERLIILADNKRIAFNKEIADIQTQIEAKKQAIATEEEALTTLQNKKIDFENNYQKLYLDNAKVRQLSIEQSIKAMERLNALSGIKPVTTSSISGTRANGGPVSSGSSYLVGERGPELFIPRNSGTIATNTNIGGSTINVNLGGVAINNSQDETRLIDKIKQALTMEARNFNLGIS